MAQRTDSGNMTGKSKSKMTWRKRKRTSKIVWCGYCRRVFFPVVAYLGNPEQSTLTAEWDTYNPMYPVVSLLLCLSSGDARICCEKGQRWKLGHGALTANFRAGCSSCLMTNSFVTDAVLIEKSCELFTSAPADLADYTIFG